jgi:hypothetical protein
VIKVLEYCLKENILTHEHFQHSLHGSNHLTLSEIIPGEYVEDTEVRISSYSSSNIGRDEYLMEA